MSTSPLIIHVTQHALLRYCERVLGADLDQISHSIAVEVAPLVAKLGDGQYSILDGQCIACVRGGIVSTILLPDLQRPGTKKPRRPKHLRPQPQEHGAFDHILELAKED
jgi:hypothetical protein